MPSTELQNQRATGAQDKKSYKRHLLQAPEPLVQNQNNFTELFLMVPSTKIAQMVPLPWTKGLPEL